MSGLVILGAVTYLVAPSRVAWAFAVEREQNAPHGTEVLYGKTSDEEGHAHKGVRILLFGTDDHSDPLAILVSDASGAYRQSIHLPRGGYVLSVAGGGVRTTRELDLDPGNAYRISAQMKRIGVFFFLPIFFY